jgi:hypothetical protein
VKARKPPPPPLPDDSSGKLPKGSFAAAEEAPKAYLDAAAVRELNPASAQSFGGAESQLSAVRFDLKRWELARRKN